MKVRGPPAETGSGKEGADIWKRKGREAEDGFRGRRNLLSLFLIYYGKMAHMVKQNLSLNIEDGIFYECD